ncbi:MAG: uncharacterized protein HW421_4124 [Ignavibacteria bacterium]|nr:uncharacterized protein [Ignavibacteria bacterium]
MVKNMENATDYCIIFVTADSYENALQISRILVSEKLAACCSIVNNITSIYEWEGSIAQTQEFMLLIKSHKNKLDNLESRITELHNYDTPEIISVSLHSASRKYLDWMNSILNN